MRVLMTGATGFIGQNVARALSDQRHQVQVLARNPEKTRRQLPFVAAAYFWDGAQRPPPESFVGVDAIIHLAGEPIAKGRWTAERKKKLWDSRIGATNNLLIGWKDSGRRIATFISASAVGIYGNRGDEVLTEESAIGVGYLADLCQAWESAARGTPPQTRVVYLRNGIVLGNGGFLHEVAPIFKLGLGGKLGGGQQWMSWIHIEDLVALTLTILRNESYGGAINAVAPEPARNRELTRALAKVLHRPGIFPAPAFAIKAAFGQMSEVLLSSQRVSAEKILNLGFQFKYSNLETAMAAAIGTLGKAIR